ncbi:hypothetical protein RZN05_15695 [Sphingomonas sp. HF-S4]|uniref:Pectate lyase superfamily protein domain-containing protein n=1 Tax=Sphingomonas agrestis TaxID=3080540 RepID=A0ABU3YAM4_9SPHN|nr:hypothetical protein [Sphingomonas sp. HF-S4]MDV3458441.1 hypothetical protein [Sphingomonas sp. HF-S4]
MKIDFPIGRRELLGAGASAALFGSAACKGAPRQPVSILDFLPSSEHRRIAEGRSSFDCGAGLERAIAAAIQADSLVWLPRGEYQLSARHALTHADTFPCLAAVRMVSGMRLHGEAGALLRMMPGFSSDQKPRAMAMFATHTPIADIEFKGLILDMNGRNNPISPERAQGIYNRLPQAHIFVSGGSGQAAARVDRARITDSVFRDSNGVSCIVMGQTADSRAVLGRDWTLERCRFLDNGMDTDDHSSIFAYAEGVKTTGCTFANVAPFGPTGVNTAYEVHGSRQIISDCKFVNMIRGIWVANNYTAVTAGTTIKDSEFRTVFYGVDFYHDRSSAKDIRQTTISGNTFTFDDTAIRSVPGLNFKVAVQIASEFAQQDVRISRNSVNKSGSIVTSAFVVITGGASGKARHDAIVAADNQGRGLTFGSFIRTTAQAGIGRVSIVRNTWTGLSPSSTMAIAAGDAVEHTGTLQPITMLTLGGGSVQASDRTRAVKPVYINAFVRYLVLDPIRTQGTVPTLELGGAARLEAVERRAKSGH